MRCYNIFAIFLLVIVLLELCLAAITQADLSVIEDIYWQYYLEKEEGTSSEQQKSISSAKQEGTSGTKPEGSSSTQQKGTSSAKQEGTSSAQQEGTSTAKQEGTSSKQHEGSSSIPQEGTSSGQQEVICNLEQKKIYGLCKSILPDLDILFNHAASFYLKPTCVEKVIKFTVKNVPLDKEIKERMMPCYGRSQPMRTSWIVDDFFDFIWIADGSEKNSMIVFLCKPFAGSKPCFFFKLITQYKIEEVDAYIVEKTRVEEELGTLKQLSSNMGQIQIDSAYINEILHKIDICNLPKEKKLFLCQKILNRNLYNYWKLKEATGDAVDCIEKQITFIYEASFISSEIKGWMYPCYGQSSNLQEKGNKYDTVLFYLSSGPIHNSIIVYHQDSNRIIKVFEVFEYINIESVLSNNTSAMMVAELFSRHDSLETEEIYKNEVYRNPVCDLPTDKKYALCLLLARRSHYSDFNWTVNEAEFKNPEVTCEEHEVRIVTADGITFNRVGNVMMMFPCYGKSIEREDYVLEFYEKAFYLSRGPRKNSVMVYKRVNNDYMVYEIMENVNFGVL